MSRADRPDPVVGPLKTLQPASETESMGEAGTRRRCIHCCASVVLARRTFRATVDSSRSVNAAHSEEPTTRVLKRLVDDEILHRDESGTHTTYNPDYRRQAMQEAMRIRDSGHTVEKLTDRLADMKAQIRD